MRGLTIHLRSPRLSDRREFLAAVRQSRSLHRGWVVAPMTAGSFRAYLKRTKRDDFRGFLACRNETDEIAEVINISQVYRRPFQSAYLGFYAMLRTRGSRADERKSWSSFA